MSLTVRLKNIGILKQAEFSLGDLTLICGENNTGKTYAAYALYGFLRSWREFINIPISDAQIERSVKKDVQIKFGQTLDQILVETCKRYTSQLDKIFAASEGTFKNSEFRLLTDVPSRRFQVGGGSIESLQGYYYTLYLRLNVSDELIATVKIDKVSEREFDIHLAKNRIKFIISNGIFPQSLPKPFILSTERTGVSIFRKELDFARDRLLREMAHADEGVDPRQLLSKGYQRYPSPIEADVDFMGQLQDITKSKSFISKEHSEILDDFTDIVGGTYAITQNDLLYYIPKGTKSRLTMDQSSSAVRSLLDLNFYLHCLAEKGDLLMVDEPELSLHPKNQRRIARLFARLVNLGIKVFITTHSDYIVKELNTLIMLNHDKPHLKRVAEENGYQDSELINVDQVKVYIAEKALLPLEEGQKRRKRGHTLVPAKIHPELGIGVSSFDKTIDDMNKIQDDIVWGEE